MTARNWKAVPELNLVSNMISSARSGDEDAVSVLRAILHKFIDTPDVEGIAQLAEVFLKIAIAEIVT